MTSASTNRTENWILHNFSDYQLSELGGFTRVRRVLPGRFFAKIRFAENGCWIWTGSTWGHPRYPVHKYGQMRGWDFTKRVSAHVFAYETVFGPIPEGFEPDHTCENKLCVNPNHLEIVTHAENCWRRNHRGQTREEVAILRAPKPPAPKTACILGHPFTSENTYIAADGRRRCRECNKIRARKFRSKLLGLGLLALPLLLASLSSAAFFPHEGNSSMITDVSILQPTVAVAYPFASSSLSRQEYDQLVKKVLPRLRMLKLVVERRPITFCPHKSVPQYTVTYYQETLECGHETVSFTAKPGKRRNCQSCVEAASQPKSKAAGVGVA